MATNVPITGETPITIKISVNDSLKKLKLPLKDLTVDVLPVKLRQVLGIQPEQEILFERFSDSAGGYVTLDPTNPAVFKTLARAAKAKLKLRLRATIPNTTTADERAQSNVQALLTELPKPPQGLSASRPSDRTPATRSSTAFDGRSVGPGIFEFTKADQPTKSAAEKPSVDEAPLPSPFTLRPKSTIWTQDSLRSRLTKTDTPVTTSSGPFTPSVKMEKTLTNLVKATTATWSVFCNECDTPMADAHYHCGICDGGDYDLCESCVQSGKLCPGKDHWLVKRFLKDGKVVSSTTERLEPKSKSKDTMVSKPTSQQSVAEEPTKEVPGAFIEAPKAAVAASFVPTRTCNCCVDVSTEQEFVTCTTCDDFDLCLKCHASNKHGHHPAHSFKPATPTTTLSLLHKSLLPAGRNARHQAICDECDKTIYGVRHKCFNCPDFDYCNDCVKHSRRTHPHHRFAAIYEPISLGAESSVRHNGIYCDGPDCTGKSHQTYIEGVRYKCVICDDTDFCANCEALPGNVHNKTHPLIKIKTPIRGLNVSTVSENLNVATHGLGDKQAQATAAQASSSRYAGPVSATSANAPVTAGMTTFDESAPAPASAPAHKEGELNAYFIRDVVPDGTSMLQGTRFTQVWTLRNPGPITWPAGCSIRYVGGDNMLNVEHGRIASAAEMADATESNVVGREVRPGEEIAFAVALRAPARLGKAISYWRLKAADGTPFGHRLWCDINVCGSGGEQSASANSTANTCTNMPPQTNSSTITPCGYPRHPTVDQTKSQRFAPSAGTKAEMDKIIAHQMLAQAQFKAHMAMREGKSPGPVQLDAYSGPHPSSRSTTGSTTAASGQINLAGNLWSTEEARMRTKHMQEALAKLRAKKMQALAESSRKSETSAGQSEKVPETKEEVVATGAQEVDDKSVKSAMVFPTLDKESPASSTYQSVTSSRTGKGKAAYVEDEETTGEPTVSEAGSGAARSSPVSAQAPTVSPVKPATEVVTPAADGFEDVGDELEVLSADGDSGDDDGFMTDEEYDILDASDQETVVSTK